jgi:hypothetical protein
VLPRVAAGGRLRELEQLCRYLTRPAIFNEQPGVNRPGQVVVPEAGKEPLRDGISHSHVMATGFESMQHAGSKKGSQRTQITFIWFFALLASNANWVQASGVFRLCGAKIETVAPN